MNCAEENNLSYLGLYSNKDINAITNNVFEILKLILNSVDIKVM